MKSREHQRVLALLEAKYGKLKRQAGESLMYIGWEVNQANPTCTKLSMKKSIRRLCEKFQVCTGLRNPARSEADFLSDGDNVPVDSKEYRSLVMEARYIADKLAREVLFHSSYLATKQTSPTRKRFADGIRILQYLWHVQDECVYIRDLGAAPEIVVETDSSFNLYADGKAQSGRALYVGTCGAALMVGSNKQHCTGTSTSATNADDSIELWTGHCRPHQIRRGGTWLRDRADKIQARQLQRGCSGSIRRTQPG